MSGRLAATSTFLSLTSTPALAAGGAFEPMAFGGTAAAIIGGGWIASKLIRGGTRAVVAPTLPEPNVEDVIKFVRIDSDGQTVHCEKADYGVSGRRPVGKAPVRFVVFELLGLNYASSTQEDMESFRRARMVWQKRLAECECAATIISDRKRLQVEIPEAGDNEWLKEVNDRWAAGFDDAFLNRNYVLLIDEGGGDLAPAIEATINTLDKGKPRLLRHEESPEGVYSPLWDFLDDLMNRGMVQSEPLNVRDLPQSLGSSRHRTDPVTGTVESYDGMSPGPHFQKFVTVSGIEEPRVTTDRGLMQKLLRLPHELTVFQYVRPREAYSGRMKVQRKRSSRMIKKDAVSRKAEAEFDTAVEEISEGEAGLSEYELVVACHGETEGQTAAGAQAVIKQFAADQNLRAVVDTTFADLQWRRRQPGAAQPLRQWDFGYDNVADFTPFPETPRGRDRCWWGPHPLRVVRDPWGAAYTLGVHQHERAEALGNVTLVGMSGSGKTVAAAWLITGALSHFPKMRVFAFDNLNGLSVSTRAFGGTVVSAGTTGPGSGAFAPLQMDDDQENREFLVKWLMAASGCTEREHEREIERGLEIFMKIERESRTLEGFLEHGLHDNTPVSEGLEALIGSGAIKGWFDGTVDSLDLEASRWITFDMTRLLEDPRLCSLYVSYVMHRIRREVWENPVPHIVFMDEAPTLFSMSPLLRETGQYLANNIRKKMGAVWFAFQEASGLGEAADIITTNSAGYFFWRNPSVNKKLYRERFSLSDGDLAFIADEEDQYRHMRRAALYVQKREGERQESTLLNLNLESLGDLLGLFRSGEDAADLANACIREFGERWVGPYLQRLKDL